MPRESFFRRGLRTPVWVLVSFFLTTSVPMSGCYSYRVATHAQPGTELTSRMANSFFWGLVQSPKEISTPVCDSLNANGVSIVQVKTNFGYALITVATLGIWCPMRIEWKCSKPCQVVGHL